MTRNNRNGTLRLDRVAECASDVPSLDSELQHAATTAESVGGSGRGIVGGPGCRPTRRDAVGATYVGVDVSARHLDAVFVDEGGRPRRGPPRGREEPSGAASS